MDLAASFPHRDISKVCCSPPVEASISSISCFSYNVFRVYHVFRVYRVYRVSRPLEPWQAWTTLLSDGFLNSCHTRRAFTMHFHKMERLITEKHDKHDKSDSINLIKRTRGVRTLQFGDLWWPGCYSLETSGGSAGTIWRPLVARLLQFGELWRPR